MKGEAKPKAEPRCNGIPPETAERLRARSEAFGRATQGRGKPMKYGAGPTKEKQ